MILMLLFLLGIVAFFISLIKASNDLEDICISSVLVIGVSFIFIIFPLCLSYGTYLDIKSTYERVQNDYKDTIEVYENKAVINVESITDFRYKGYQDNLGNLIKDLRNITAEYNKTFIKKRTMNNNIFFSWYTIGPSEDMKLLKLKE